MQYRDDFRPEDEKPTHPTRRRTTAHAGESYTPPALGRPGCIEPANPDERGSPFAPMARYFTEAQEAGLAPAPQLEEPEPIPLAQIRAGESAGPSAAVAPLAAPDERQRELEELRRRSPLLAAFGL